MQSSLTDALIAKTRASLTKSKRISRLTNVLCVLLWTLILMTVFSIYHVIFLFILLLFGIWHVFCVNVSRFESAIYLDRLYHLNELFTTYITMDRNISCFDELLTAHCDSVSQRLLPPPNRTLHHSKRLWLSSGFLGISILLFNAAQNPITFVHGLTVEEQLNPDDAESFLEQLAEKIRAGKATEAEKSLYMTLLTQSDSAAKSSSLPDAGHGIRLSLQSGDGIESVNPLDAASEEVLKLHHASFADANSAHLQNIPAEYASGVRKYFKLLNDN